MFRAGVNLNDAMKMLSDKDVRVIRGLTPGSGLGRALSPNYDVVGGRGSPYGAMETRVQKPKSETTELLQNQFGGMFGRFGQWLSDPLAYKENKKYEQERLEEARKYGNTVNQQRALMGSLSSLVGRTKNVQTSLMALQFQVLQIIGRNTMGIARQLGVDSRKFSAPELGKDPGILTNILKKIGEDLQRIPGVGILSTVGKHAYNTASFLNPFTMGSRVKNAVASFSDKAQRFILGKQGYEYAKDPNAAAKDAGVYLEDSKRMANLAKVQANYLKEQLNVQWNIYRVVKEIAVTQGVSGESISMQRLDIDHDEYSGSLKTRRDVLQDRSRRESQLTLQYQKAYRKGALGKVMPLLAIPMGKTQGQMIKKSRKDMYNVTTYDSQVFNTLFDTGGIFTLAEGNPRLESIISGIDFENDFFITDDLTAEEKQRKIRKLSELKREIYTILDTGSGRDKSIIKEAQKSAAQRESPSQLTARWTQKLANVAKYTGGKYIPSTREIIGRSRNLDETSNNVELAKIYAGKTHEELLTEATSRNIGPVLARSIPGLGIFAGLWQLVQEGQADAKVEKMLQSNKSRKSAAQIMADTDSKTGSTGRDAADTAAEIKNTLMYRALDAAFSKYFVEIPLSIHTKLPAVKRNLLGTIGTLNMTVGPDGVRRLEVNPEDDNRETVKEQQKELEEEKQKEKQNLYQSDVVDQLRRINERVAEVEENTDQDSSKNKKRSLFDKLKDANEKANSKFGDMITDNLGKIGFAGAMLFGPDILPRIAGKVIELVEVGLGKVFTFIGESVGKLGEAAMEHPWISAGVLGAIATKFIPGGIGGIIAKAAGLVAKNPVISLMTVVGGGIVYKLISSFSESEGKEADGANVFSDVFKQILAGGESGVGGMFGKAAIFGFAGGKVAGFKGFIAGAAIGMIMNGIVDDYKSLGDISWKDIAMQILIGKEGAQGASLRLIGATIGALGGGPVGAVLGLLVGGAISSLIDAMGKHEVKDKNLRTQLDNLEAARKGEIEDLNKNGHTVDAGFGNTVKLTEEEYQEYLKLPEGGGMHGREVYARKKHRERVHKHQNAVHAIIEQDKKLQNEREKNGETGGPSEMDYLMSGGSTVSKIPKLNTKKEIGGPENIDYTNSWGQVPVDVIKDYQENTNSENTELNKPEIPNTTATNVVNSINKEEAAKTSEHQTASNTGSGEVSSNSGNNEQTGSSSGNGLNFFENMISSALKAAITVGQGAFNLLGGAASGISNLFGGSYDTTGIDANDLGAVSEKFESSGKSEDVTYDANKETAYGRYQFTSEGSMQDFIKWAKDNGGADGKRIYDTMIQATGGDLGKLKVGESNSGPVVDAWKSLAKAGVTSELESKFAKYYYYDKAFNKLDQPVQKLVSSSKPLQQALFSAAIQHGPNKPSGNKKGAVHLFNDAFRIGMSPEQYATSIYKLRAERYPITKSRFMKEHDLVQALIRQENGGGIGEYTTGGKSIDIKGAWKGYPNISSDLLEQWKLDNNMRLAWPADSAIITSPAGERKVKKGTDNHRGIDIRAREKEPIYAALAGKVKRTSRRLGTVEIEHPGGWATRYLHLSRFNVKAGDQVSPGQKIGGSGGIGKSGSTEYTPHLHFEMLKDGINVDPEGVFYQAAMDGQRTKYDPVGGYKPDVPKNMRLQAKFNRGFKASNAPDVSAMPRVAGGEIGGPDEPSTKVPNDMLGNLNSNIRGYMEMSNGQKKDPSEEIVKKLDEVKAATIAAAAKTQQTINAPVVSVSAPAEGSTEAGTEGTGQISLGDPSIDKMIDNLFSCVGNMLSSFSIAHTNLVTTTT